MDLEEFLLSRLKERYHNRGPPLLVESLMFVLNIEVYLDTSVKSIESKCIYAIKNHCYTVTTIRNLLKTF